MLANWKDTRITPLLLLLALVCSVAISSLNPIAAGAANKGELSMANGSVIDTNRYGPILNHQMYYFLLNCFAHMDGYALVLGDVSKYDFFQKTKGMFGGSKESVRGGMYEREDPGCDEEQYVKEAVNSLGWSNPYDFICSLSFSYSYKYGGNGREGSVGGEKNKSSCLAGQSENNNEGDYRFTGSNWVSKVEETLKTKKEGAAAVKPLSKADEYIRAYRTLVKRCDVSLVENFKEKNPVTSGNQVQLNIINEDGSLDRWLAHIEKPDDKVKYVATRTAGGAQEKTCKDLALLVMENSVVYAQYVKKSDNIKPDSKDINREGCRDGDENCDPAETTTSCNIDGIGWIICPVITFLGGVTDTAYGAVEGLLRFDSAIIADSNLQAAWANFRNIANVLFVIAFLFIIYSQMTGAGLNNYGIKKMLPKIIIAAILVNISFWLCAIAVDVTNILGSSLKSMFDSLATSSGGSDSTALETVGQGITWVAILVGILMAGMGIALAVSVPVLLAAVLAVAMILLILMLRQALIILLIVIAPIAFVAYLLPNTEQWFKKWMKLFGSLLMLYPIVAVVFGASAFAAKLVANIGSGDINSEMLQITALGIATVPFFVVPSLLKSALNATGSLGTKLSGLSGRATSNVGSKVKTSSRLGEATAAYKQRRAVGRADRRINSRFHKAIDNSRVGRALGGDRGAAAAAAAVTRTENEAVDNAALVMQKQAGWTAANTIPNAQNELAQAIAAGDVTRARAAQKILLGSGSKGVAAAGDTLSRSVHSENINTPTVQYLKSDITSAGLKGKDAALDAWSRDNEVITNPDGSKAVRTVMDKAMDPSVNNGLTDVELAGQSVHRIAEGGVSRQRAVEIMSNEAVWANLSEDKKELIRRASTGESIKTNSTVNSQHEQAIDIDSKLP